MNEYFEEKFQFSDEQKQKFIEIGLNINASIFELNQFFSNNSEKITQFYLDRIETIPDTPKTIKPFYRKNERW